MKRIMEIAEQFEQAVREAFPGCTDATIYTDDGHISVEVMRWGDHSQREIVDTPRVYLMKRSRNGGEWGTEESTGLNAYLKQHGLLETEEGAQA